MAGNGGARVKKIKTAQNVLKHILVLGFLKSDEILKFGNCPQTTKQSYKRTCRYFTEKIKSLRSLEAMRLKIGTFTNCKDHNGSGVCIKYNVFNFFQK